MSGAEEGFVTIPKDSIQKLRAAFRPNELMRIYVPDRDHEDNPLPLPGVLAVLQEACVRLVGGQSTFLSTGGFQGSAESFRERTACIEAYLPGRVDRTLRDALVRLILGIGVICRQELVLVAVGSTAYRVPVRRIAQGRG
jgi:hypothetical protein